MTTIRYAVLLSLGSWIAWVDFRTRRIPNSLLLTMAVFTLAGYAFHSKLIFGAFGCALVFAIFTLPISLLRKRSLGGGDSKLIVMLAFLLGRGAHMMSGLILATIFGAFHILILAMRDRHLPRGIPFAPALIIGALLSA